MTDYNHAVSREIAVVLSEKSQKRDFSLITTSPSGGAKSFCS
jgi:hypothetical protein